MRISSFQASLSLPQFIEALRTEQKCEVALEQGRAGRDGFSVAARCEGKE